MRRWQNCCRNLHLVGRNGMHKYNNQDHAMMTAMLAARNILAGRRVFDVWAVNQDGEYHEAGEAGGKQPAAARSRAISTALSAAAKFGTLIALPKH